MAGLEPAASPTRTVHSTKLSYIPSMAVDPAAGGIFSDQRPAAQAKSHYIAMPYARQWKRDRGRCEFTFH